MNKKILRLHNQNNLVEIMNIIPLEEKRKQLNPKIIYKMFKNLILLQALSIRVTIIITILSIIIMITNIQVKVQKKIINIKYLNQARKMIYFHNKLVSCKIN